MYKVIVKRQRPDYEWEKMAIGPLDTKESADKYHASHSIIASDLLKKGYIIDYQIETIERA